MVLALLFVLAQASPVPDIDGPIFTNPATMSQLAFFEFAPSNGAGMGTACACAAVTGAKGEPLTFTRASSATCTKGNPTTGIQPGDLVTCASDQPRVGNPDGLGLALLAEKTSQNVLGKSEQFDNVTYWSKVETSGTVTVTANQALSPFNTMAAERLQVSACPTVGQRSMLYQGQVQAGSHIASVFLMGTSTTQIVNVCAFGTTGACAPCTVPATSYTRCDAPVTTGGVLAYLLVGCNNDTVNYTGASNTGAADVYIFGAQVEAGTVTTSYIPTDTVAVTRAVDRADVALTFAPTAGLSVAGTFITPSNASWNVGGGAPAPVLTSGTLGAAINGSLYFWPYISAGPALSADTAGVVSAGVASYNPGFSAFPSTTMRVAAYHTGTKIGVCQTGSACTESGASTFGTPSFTRVMIGHSAANALNDATAYYRAICVDPDPNRCR